MADNLDLQAAVEQAVSQALEASVPAFQQQIIQRVLAKVSQLAEHVVALPPAVSSSMEALNTATARIQAAHSQIEILDALVEETTQFCGRSALYVIRGTTAMGWRARGFEDNDAIRSLPLEFKTGLAAKAIEHSTSVMGEIGEFDSAFTSRMSAPDDGRVLLVPLIVRDKCVALLYADSKGTGLLDQSAILAVVRLTSLWLEVTTTRRPSAELPQETVRPVERPAVVDFQEPMPTHASVVTATPTFATTFAQSAQETAVAVLTQAAPERPAPSTEDPVHQKARRFAKLLVEEIKLYNQAKVTEGRNNSDLYDRLHDDIEKSRASYDKRYAATPVASSDYFNQELIRILADNDAALLGSNFRR